MSERAVPIVLLIGFSSPLASLLVLSFRLPLGSLVYMLQTRCSSYLVFSLGHELSVRLFVFLL